MLIFSGGTHRRSTGRPRPQARLFPAAAIVLLGGFIVAAGLPGVAGAAPPDRREAPPAESPETAEVFARIARAWQNADERALADLVHPDGLRVTGEEVQARSLTYSPSQAFYYFKNLFQSDRTISFEFQRHQDPSAGERVHGLAVWQHGRPGSADDKSLKLVFVLIRSQERWMLSEITAIR